MSDEAPATEPAAEGAEAPPVAPPAIDHKAGINEAMKKAGIRLKAKDREYIPKDIDDLARRAERSFGLDAEIESFKAEKTEAARVKAWKTAIESDDEGAAEQAFESLAPKAQQAAARWLQKKAEAWEKERALPPEALESKRRADELEREVRGYKQREAEQQQQVESQQRQREMQEANAGVLKVAKGVMEALKVDIARAPRAQAALTPVVARHMRVALMAEAETGVAVDPQEILENARQDVAQSFAAVAEGMGDDALYEAMGASTVKRLLKAHLARVKGIKPTTKANGAPRTEAPKKASTFGTPAYFRDP